MDTICGMTLTGRRFAGPAADLVELVNDKGLKHTAIVFNKEYRDYAGLTSVVQEVLPFTESAGVEGMCDLVDHDPGIGAYVYPTGTVWSVAEVVKAFADMGKPCGVRAGLELCYHAGQILLEAATVGSEMDVYSHTGFTPWRVMIRQDGQVRVIGYGLPQVEILGFLEDDSWEPGVDSFRYCPPERLDGEPEDFTSDLFSLALVAFELMTGMPVYDGLVKDVFQQASRAEGQRRLYQMKDKLSNDVREVLSRCLKFDPDARFIDGGDFVYAVHDVLTLPDVEGPSLAEAIHQVKLAEKKSKVLVGGMTGALSKADLRALAEDLEDVEAGDLPPPRLARGDEPEPEPEPEPEQARWGKVSRSSRRGRGVEPAPEPRGRSRSESGRRTRRGAAEEPPSRSSRRGADSGRRIRRSRDSDPEERPARQMRRGAAKSSSRRTRRGADDSEDPRSRLRRSSRRGEEPEPSRSRRGRREPEPEPEPEEDRRDDTTSAAEALLARLRSSAGLNKTPKSTAKKATPTKPPPPQREALPQKPEPTDEVANVTSKAAGTDKQYYNISVNGGTPRRTKLKLGAPLAESAHKLSDALCGTPTDLTGHLTGWFRLEQGGQHWSGDQTSEVLDPDSVVDLVFVQNRVVPVTFRIEGAGEPMRFQAPVGTAVPVRSLVAHLKSWLNLPAGNWSLLVGGKPLGPLQILEDYTPDEGFEVVVRQ